MKVTRAHHVRRRGIGAGKLRRNPAHRFRETSDIVRHFGYEAAIGTSVPVEKTDEILDYLLKHTRTSRTSDGKRIPLEVSFSNTLHPSIDVRVRVLGSFDSFVTPEGLRTIIGLLSYHSGRNVWISTPELDGVTYVIDRNNYDKIVNRIEANPG